MMSASISYQLSEGAQVILSLIAYVFAMLFLRWYWIGKILSNFLYLASFMVMSMQHLPLSESIIYLLTLGFTITLGIIGLFTWAPSETVTQTLDSGFATPRSNRMTPRLLPVNIRIVLLVAIPGIAVILYMLGMKTDGRMPINEFTVLGFTGLILLVLRYFEGWIFIILVNILWLAQSVRSMTEYSQGIFQLIHPGLDLLLSIVTLVVWLNALNSAKQATAGTIDQ